MGLGDVDGVLGALHERYMGLVEGEVATYIPELASVDPDLFGISLATVAGEVHCVGDGDASFTMQSVSKPFVYGMALKNRGRGAVHSRVGVEPTGDAFNSIITLDAVHRPHNPMVNAGAIATTCLLAGDDYDGRLEKMVAGFGRYAGRELVVDERVFHSEDETGDRNRAIAYLMANFGMIDGDVEAVLDLYFKQCAVALTTRDLSVMAGTLANGGVNPVTGERVLAAEYVRDVLTVMFTCGMYDSSGTWAYKVGLPAKSGVSGGVIAVVPGRFGVAVYSPRLDAHSHSVRGVKVLEDLSANSGVHLFGGGGMSLVEGVGPPEELVVEPEVGEAAETRLGRFMATEEEG